jgi:hypothetical protein
VNKRTGLIVGIAVVAVAVVVVLLVSGGSEAPSAFDDDAGDVSVAEGPKAPEDTAAADIVDAQVTRDGERLVFTATMDDEIPERVQDGSLSWRWDLYVNGTGEWIVSATVDVESSASITSTQSDYGAGTFDDSLPGSFEIDGDTLTLTLRPDDIPDFPADFTWSLGTSLDGDQGDPESALATDKAPDEGRGRLEG